MNKAEQYLGFNDTRMIVIGLFIVGPIMPIAFFSQYPWVDPYQYLGAALQSIGFSLIYWVVDRYIFFYFLGRFPNFHQNNQRIWISASTIALWTIVFSFGSPLIIDICIDQYQPNPHERTEIFVGSLFVTTIVVLLYEGMHNIKRLKESAQRSEELKKENLKSQLETLKNQVNPHFLFNSLNTLSASIHDDPDFAVAFVQNMSRVYRYVLDTKELEFVQLREEIRHLDKYLFLLKARFGENIQLDLDDQARNSYHYLVPLSLQMLIENAVKHNIVSSSKPLKITIGLTEERNLLVSNTLQLKRGKPASTGLGLDNIRRRYQLTAGKDIQVNQTEEDFQVILPLIEIKDYAHTDH